MKNGFTLVELIVVISILAIIALISVPVVNNVITDSKEKAYMEQENSIVNAAKTYMTNHSSELPTSTSNPKIITVAELKTAGLLKNEEIKNPVGANYKDYNTYKERGEYFDGIVTVNWKENKYTYEYTMDLSNYRLVQIPYELRADLYDNKSDYSFNVTIVKNNDDNPNVLNNNIWVNPSDNTETNNLPNGDTIFYGNLNIYFEKNHLQDGEYSYTVNIAPLDGMEILSDLEYIVSINSSSSNYYFGKVNEGENESIEIELHKDE